MARNSPRAVEDFEDDAGVVGEAAHDGVVALYVILQAAMAQAGLDGVEAFAFARWRRRSSMAKTSSATGPSFSAVFSRGLAFAFVDGLDEGVALVLGNALGVHEIGPELAVAEADDEILLGQAEGAEDVDERAR